MTVAPFNKLRPFRNLEAYVLTNYFKTCRNTGNFRHYHTTYKLFQDLSQHPTRHSRAGGNLYGLVSDAGNQIRAHD